jgi:hypothetical protein
MMRRPSWRTWVIANALGGTVGLLAGVLAAVVSAGLGFGLLIGLGLGLAQRHVLVQTAHPQPATQPMPLRWWVAVSALGGILPGWLILVAVVLGASNGGQPVTDRATYVGGVLGAAALFGAISGALGGGAAGAVQGWVLYRSRPVGTWAAVRWSLASSLGWAGGWALTGAGAGAVLTAGGVGGTLRLALLIGGSGLLLGAWAVNGIITGSVLGQ